MHPGETSEHRRRSIDLGFGLDSWDDTLDTRWRWSSDGFDTSSPWSGVDMSPSGLDTRSPLSSGGVPGRRTVTITGQGAEGYASRNGTRPSMAQRHRPVKRHERPGFRPDRAAM